MRPKAIAEKICSQITTKTNELSINNIETENGNFSFALYDNIGFSFSNKNKKVFIDPNFSDMSGMGGYFSMFYE